MHFLYPGFELGKVMSGDTFLAPVWLRSADTSYFLAAVNLRPKSDSGRVPFSSAPYCDKLPNTR